MAKEEEYKWVGTHAQDLADGRMLAPGETVKLSEEDVRHPHNESLIADGGLIPLTDPAEHEAQLAERRAARREARTEPPAVPGDKVPNPEEEEGS